LGFKEQLSEEELEELLRPKLRLFMSVDVIGSTAFKNNSEHSESQGWLDFLFSFYSSFSTSFAAQRTRIAQKAGLKKPLRAPRLWKSLGDELIYEVELTQREDAALYLSAFRSAVNRRIRYQSQEGEGRLPISFKATAWVAGFPVNNAAIPLQGTGTGDTEYDYVGPHIDIGFRLTNFASARRFVISVELAYLLTKVGLGDIDIFYEERKPLKGVLENRGSPIIWIDAHQEDRRVNPTPSQNIARLEDELTGRSKTDGKVMRDYCEAYIRNTGSPLFLPWLPSDPEPFEDPPADYDEKMESVKARLRRVFIRVGRTGEEPSSLANKKNEAKEGDKPIPGIEDKLEQL